MKLLFVCTGNTCRSPLAAAIARTRLPHAEIASAGLAAVRGAEASPHARAVLAEHGLPTAHAAQPLEYSLLEGADAVLVMTESHRRAILARWPDAAAKVRTLAEAAGEVGDVPDPFGGSLDTYRHTFRELDKLIARLERGTRAENLAGGKGRNGK